MKITIEIPNLKDDTPLYEWRDLQLRWGLWFVTMMLVGFSMFVVASSQATVFTVLVSAANLIATFYLTYLFAITSFLTAKRFGEDIRIERTASQ